jgi:hypothetical protein
MKKSILALVLCLLLVSVAAAKKETVDLGAFKVEFDMGISTEELQFNVYPPLQDKDRNIYSFRIEDAPNEVNLGGSIDVEIEDYGTLVDVSQSRLMNEYEKLGSGNVDFDWKLFPSIGELPAVLANATYKDGSGFSYMAAYSPDGVGYRGSIIAYIGSSCPEDVTNAFLSKLKISRV